MINFVWVVLISLVVSVIVSILVIGAGYILFDSVRQFFIKKKIPKDHKVMLDGGEVESDIQKEVKLDDGRYREYEKLRSIAIRERTAKTQDNVPRSIANESRDVKIDAIARGVNDGNTKPVEDKW